MCDLPGNGKSDMSHTISITDNSIKWQNSIAVKIVMASQDGEKKKGVAGDSELKKQIK